MNGENAFTKAQLMEMWKRPVTRQYNIASTKIYEAIQATQGDILICFSGGKDSSLLLDMYCEIVSTTDYRNTPVRVGFANTTNETSSMMSFIPAFISWCEQKYNVKIDFSEVRPEKGVVWASFVLKNGIPLISKQQSKAIRSVKRDMLRTGLTYDELARLSEPNLKSVRALFDLGFSKTGVLALTGYVSKRKEFGQMFKVSRKWLPMVSCEVDLTEQCCVKMKERPLGRVSADNIMTGEQAAESAAREIHYLQTGCNSRMANGRYKSKPFGAMTSDGILFALSYRGTPICPDYGSIVCENGHYYCTKATRTGCALCGFGCQYDTDRFVRLQETDPAKVAFAFKPKTEGGAGYLEAVAFMNEHCGTKVIIPQV